MTVHSGPLASTIVTAIIMELDSRRGFDEWWYGMDKDIRQEIADELKLKTLALLEAHS